MTAERLRIHTLGGLSIERGGEAVDDFASRKAQALLVYLACTEREHPREVLAELLWDDRSQRQALANLRVVLSSLRKEVGPFVAITRTTAAMDDQADVWLDAAELEKAAEDLQDEEAPLSSEDVETLKETLDLYEGDFLAGFFLPEAAGFETWATAERERLHRLALEALLQLGRWHLEQGDYAAAVASATRLLDIDQLSEAGHRQLMEALARSGHRSQALAQYDTCREILAEELGVEPAAETEALHQAIRAGDVAKASRATEATEIGSRQTTLNLPQKLTPFIGRERELADLRGLLGDEQVRLRPGRDRQDAPGAGSGAHACRKLRGRGGVCPTGAAVRN
jgi:DNA-binding SARP family transcriptional activator